MIETLTSNPLTLVLIFPVVTLTIFVVGIIRMDIAKFNQKHVFDQIWTIGGSSGSEKTPTRCPNILPTRQADFGELVFRAVKLDMLSLPHIIINVGMLCQSQTDTPRNFMQNPVSGASICVFLDPFRDECRFS